MEFLYILSSNFKNIQKFNNYYHINFFYNSELNTLKILDEFNIFDINIYDEILYEKDNNKILEETLKILTIDIKNFIYDNDFIMKNIDLIKKELSILNNLQHLKNEEFNFLQNNYIKKTPYYNYTFDNEYFIYLNEKFKYHLKENYFELNNKQLLTKIFYSNHKVISSNLNLINYFEKNIKNFINENIKNNLIFFISNKYFSNFIKNLNNIKNYKIIILSSKNEWQNNYNKIYNENESYIVIININSLINLFPFINYNVNYEYEKNLNILYQEINCFFNNSIIQKILCNKSNIVIENLLSYKTYEIKIINDFIKRMEIDKIIFFENYFEYNEKIFNLLKFYNIDFNITKKFLLYFFNNYILFDNDNVNICNKNDIINIEIINKNIFDNYLNNQYIYELIKNINKNNIISKIEKDEIIENNFNKNNIINNIKIENLKKLINSNYNENLNYLYELSNNIENDINKVNSQKNFFYEQFKLIKQNELVCPITLEYIKDNNYIILSCGHIFTSLNIIEYLIMNLKNKNNIDCPCCRKEIEYENILIMDENIDVKYMFNTVKKVRELIEKSNNTIFMVIVELCDLLKFIKSKLNIKNKNIQFISNKNFNLHKLCSLQIQEIIIFDDKYKNELENYENKLIINKII
jgi:hypothetical protein